MGIRFHRGGGFPLPVPLSLLIILFLVTAQAATRPFSDRIANYDIKVRFQPDTKRVEGTEIITWRNTSEFPVQEVWFHLYWNAAKSPQSTALKEAATEEDDWLDPSKVKEWGWISVEHITLLDGTDLMPTFEYMHPDDGNRLDQTVFRIKLATPVKPGTNVTLRVAWSSRIPRGFIRTGYERDFYFFGQWFPKVGVLNRDGSWNCHQYHSRSEFYADFGTYKVTLTVPKNLTVVASGQKVARTQNDNATVTYTYSEDDIHDFAWAAAGNVILASDRFEEPGLHSVEISLLLQPEHTRYRNRIITATKYALHFFGTWYGEYPYSTLTIVDPKPGTHVGGMEYPTLFTIGLPYRDSAWMRAPEALVIHEAGHQWWYGMVANNETEHAWLDEGFVQYATSRLLQVAYGPELPDYGVAGLEFQRFVPIPLESVPIIPLPYFARSDSALAFFRDEPLVSFPSGVPQLRAGADRRAYLMAPQLDPIDRNSWETYPFYPRGAQGVGSYFKPATFLATLESYFGQELWGRVMRTYFQRWSFRHPTQDDFLRVVNEVSGQDVTPFFDQIIQGTGLLDYGIADIRSSSTAAAGGTCNSIDAPAGEITSGTELLVRRYGDIIFPTDVAIEFQDGQRVVEHWDGKDRWKRFRYQRRCGISRAELYPRQTMWLDANLTNNVRTTAPSKAPALRLVMIFVFWLQNALYWYGSLA